MLNLLSMINHKRLYFVFVLIFSFYSCENIQKKIDTISINNMQKEIFSDFQTGNLEELKLFIDSFDIENDTKPLFEDKINISGREKWCLNGKLDSNIIEEIISFPSLLSEYIPNDSAIFYSYRLSEFKDSKTILWIPGYGVSDMAFFFIKNLFLEELKHDYNVVVYIPPYHLDRKIEGKDDGDGFFSANMLKNLKINFEELREIRTINLFLKKQGVKEISCWGGSMGASTLLLSTKFTDYKHISLMIPVVDWQASILNNKHFSSLLDSLITNGCDSLSIVKALRKMSPTMYNLPIKPDNIFVQYSNYDQLNSASVIKQFIRRNNIKNVKSYNTSHATILLSRKLYKDYAAFLDSVNLP